MFTIRDVIRLNGLVYHVETVLENSCSLRSAAAATCCVAATGKASTHPMGAGGKVTIRYGGSVKEDDAAKEAALEDFLFGKSALLDAPASVAELVRQAAEPDSEGGAEGGSGGGAGEDVDDGDELFFEDRAAQHDLLPPSDDDEAGPGPGSERDKASGGGSSKKASGVGQKRRAPVWTDPADQEVKMDVASVSRLRKLRQFKGQTSMSGAQYVAALRRQHAALNPRTSWAGGRVKPGADDANVGEIDEAAEPDEETAEQLLRSGAALLAAGGAANGGQLPQGRVELSRLRDANNADPSDAVVRALTFHPDGQLLLTGGFDKRLRLFHVDGFRNPLLQSIFLADCPVHSAAFAAGGRRVVAAGRRPFYYVADLESGSLERVVAPPCLHQAGGGVPLSKTPACRPERPAKGRRGTANGASGSSNSNSNSRGTGTHGMRSCESFVASPDASQPLLAFLGDGGHVGLVSLSSRRPVGALKMNGTARAAAFSADGRCLITAGAHLMHTRTSCTTPMRHTHINCPCASESFHQHL